MLQCGDYNKDKMARKLVQLFLCIVVVIQLTSSLPMEQEDSAPAKPTKSPPESEVDSEQEQEQSSTDSEPEKQEHTAVTEPEHEEEQRTTVSEPEHEEEEQEQATTVSEPEAEQKVWHTCLTGDSCGVAQWAERWSLIGELSLSCAMTCS